MVFVIFYWTFCVLFCIYNIIYDVLAFGQLLGVNRQRKQKLPTKSSAYYSKTGSVVESEQWPLNKTGYR